MKHFTESQHADLLLILKGIKLLRAEIKNLEKDDLHVFTNQRKIIVLQDQMCNLWALSTSILETAYETAA